MADAVADKKIELRVITMKATGGGDNYKCYGPVDMAIMRCTTGDLGILPGREDISAVLNDYGTLRILTESSESRMIVYGGIVQLKNGVLTILTEQAEWPEEINQSIAEKDLSDAEAAGDRLAARKAALQIEVSGYVNR